MKLNFINIKKKKWTSNEYKIKGNILYNLNIKYKKMLKRRRFYFYENFIYCYYNDKLVIRLYGRWKGNYFIIDSLLSHINNNNKYIRYKK